MRKTAKTKLEDRGEPLYPEELYSTSTEGGVTVNVYFAAAYSNEELDQNRKNLEDVIKMLYAKDGVIISGVNFDNYPATTKRIYKDNEVGN